jgi:hypothetical protein
MSTVSDLGKKAKKKYPEFRHLSDADAGRAFKQRYPGAYDHYTEEALVPYGQHSLEISPRLEQNIQHIWDEHVPGMWRIITYFKRKRTETENNNILAGNTQLQRLLDRAIMTTNHVALREKTIAELQLFITQNQYKLFLIAQDKMLVDEAVKFGLTLDNNQERIMLDFDANRRVNEERAKTNIQIMREERLYDLREKEKESEHRRMMEKLDKELQREITMAEAEIRLAILGNNMTHDRQQVFILQELIDQQYRKMDEIKKGGYSPDIEQWMLESRKALVENLTRERDSYGKGVQAIPADNRQEI